MPTLDNIINHTVREEQKVPSGNLILQLMKLRNQRGLTQNQLAKKINVSHTTIARIENFEMQPTIKMLMQILDVYNMKLAIVNKNEYTHKDPYVDSDNSENTVITRKVLNEIVGDCKKSIFISMSNGNDYNVFIDKIMSTYSDILLKHKISESIVTKINRFNKYIAIVLSEYYCGRHNASYELFKEALNSCIDISVFIRNIPNDCTLYRGRKNEGKKFNKDELFHIPYESRYKVSTQRYSYPGLPCLYLGSSPEICAIELDENISNLTLAKFIYYRNSNNCKILDLTSLFFDYLSELRQNNVESFLINFPLILICSTYIKYDNESDAKFKKEYVIPQLLLEYIINESITKDSNVIGIKYFSVKEDFIAYFLNGDLNNLQKICNYVFPTWDVKKSKGYCSQLKTMFNIVEIYN